MHILAWLTNLKDWVNIGRVQLISTTIGLSFVVFQIAGARRETRIAHARQDRELDRIRRESTLEFARSTLDHRYTSWSDLADDFNREKIAEMLVKCMRKRRSTTLRSAFEYLGLLETFAIGIYKGIYDMETAHSLYGGRIVAVTTNYQKLIDRRRKESGRSSMYVWLEGLAKRFREHERLGHSGFAECDCSRITVDGMAATNADSD